MPLNTRDIKDFKVLVSIDLGLLTRKPGSFCTSSKVQGLIIPFHHFILIIDILLLLLIFLLLAEAALTKTLERRTNPNFSIDGDGCFH